MGMKKVWLRLTGTTSVCFDVPDAARSHESAFATDVTSLNNSARRSPLRVSLAFVSIIHLSAKMEIIIDIKGSRVDPKSLKHDLES